MTHRDGLPRFSARSVRRGDPGSAGGFAEASAVYRETSATLSESLGKPLFRSPLRPVRRRRKALTMSRIARVFPPTRLPTIWHGPKRAAWTIPIGHYHRSLVLTRETLL